MSTFKDQLENDLAVFLNMGEFASTHIINGVETVSILESPTTENYFAGKSKDASFEGLHGSTMVLHVKTEDLPEKVVHGNIINLDDDIYKIASTAEDMGITTLVLEADVV